MTLRVTEQEAIHIARYYEQVDAFERDLLQRALDAARGDPRTAADSLGLSVAAFELKSERLGVGFVRTAAPPRGEW
jgi:DNA-binding NtrC family response regulator